MRKNDQERKGHQMRFRVSSDPQLRVDIPYQLCLFMDIAGTTRRLPVHWAAWQMPDMQMVAAA